jgi:hypothetical protein
MAGLLKSLDGAQLGRALSVPNIDKQGRLVATIKSAEYRAKARECEERAERTSDTFIKQQLIEAEKWRTMASNEEKYGR